VKKLGLSVCLFAAIGVQCGAAENTGFIMRDVYDAIVYLLPLSLRAPDASSIWDSELVQDKLDDLVRASAILVDHARDQDAEFRLLARSFDRLVNDTATSFREEWPDYAYYSLMELTDHCVACHSRLPAGSQDLFGQRLMARMDTAALTERSKASLYVATRQFDAALGVLESSLLSPSMDPVEAEYRGLMLQYLRIAIAAEGGIARIKRLLEGYLARADLPYYLRFRLQHWQAALEQHAGSLDDPPDIARAHALFDTATRLSLAPGNRIRAVEDLVAARIMRTYLLENTAIEPADRAEIYYRLAVIALRTNEPEPSVPEMEMLFVAAIEADPKGPNAKRAYALLEQYGYVHEEHLAKQIESHLLIDMPGLRAAIGVAP
jgi:hypothetical protein